MSERPAPYPQKWRPTLGMIVIAMLIFVLALPIGGIWLFRFYDALLVRETENELIMQGAFISAIMRREMTERRFNPARLAQSAPTKNPKTHNLTLPQIELPTAKILPRRANAVPTTQPVNSEMLAIGRSVFPILKDAQETTLAGYRILDSSGVVIAGATEVGQSLAHVDEVRNALSGIYASVLRERRSKNPTPPIYSISRGTNIRVFVAMPIEYEGKIAGVVYLSRTPSHFLREMYGQINQVIAALLFILIVTLAIGFLFIRTIKGPIDALNQRTKRIAKGDRDALKPLSRHGTREIASLSQGLLSMSEKLQDRSDYIRTFATHVSHELKSPITSIHGAAELLRDDGRDMADEKRNQFLNNIMQDTERLSRLLDRLRELASTEQSITIGQTGLRDCIAQTAVQFPKLTIIYDQTKDVAVRISAESLGIILSNLFENSERHGAETITITAAVNGKSAIIRIADNGSGISATNRAKIFEMFFTTRRESGGTGMGLSIIQSILNTHGGSIDMLESEQGTTFEVTVPLAR